MTGLSKMLKKLYLAISMPRKKNIKTDMKEGNEERMREEIIRKTACYDSKNYLSRHKIYISSNQK
jgi:hypothetical protein